MITQDLYNTKKLITYLEEVYQGKPVPISLGAILTIEMAAREVSEVYQGIKFDTLN